MKDMLVTGPIRTFVDDTTSIRHTHTYSLSLSYSLLLSPFLLKSFCTLNLCFHQLFSLHFHYYFIYSNTHFPVCNVLSLVLEILNISIIYSLLSITLSFQILLLSLYKFQNSPHFKVKLETSR